MHAVNPFLHLQHSADENPNGIFARTPDEVIGNAEAVILVKKLAYELRRLGVRAGDVVAVDVPDRLSILFALAVYHEGAISTALPPGYLANDAVPVRWVFTNRGTATESDAQRIDVDARFLQQVEQNPYGIQPSEVEIDTLRIVFSSGTTGTPKAIGMGRTMERAMDAALPYWFVGGPIMTLLDTGTAAGFGEFYLSVKAGQPFLCAGGATPAALVRLAHDAGVRTLKGSPNQLAAIVDELESQRGTLPGIDTVYSVGTVLAPSIAERLRQVTAGCDIRISYGSTEAGAATIRPVDSQDPYDLGHLAPGTSLEVVDDDHVAVPAGTVGSIRYRTPGMADGYLGAPEATARAFRDGWFYPGDLGFVRDDGGLTFVGRDNEVLNAGGVKIDGGRLDDAALRDPGVADACSFDYERADGVRGIGLALVVDDAFDVETLLGTLTREFGHASPTLVARVETIPRTATGKPLRRELAERYREG